METENVTIAGSPPPKNPQAEQDAMLKKSLGFLSINLSS